METKELLAGRLSVAASDITRVAAEAIVNAANSSLLGGGPAILEECRRLRASRLPDGLPTGEAAVTGAGRLPCRYVIHTVGPVWHGGRSGEAEKLSSCYRRSLEEAAALGLRTVAFPAISTGVYGFPKDAAARVAFDTVRRFLQQNRLPEKVLFVFFSGADAELFLAAIEADRPA
jgi:O-acetyl-ADP-ribose deacetylase (regulator of RNase III)